MKNRMPMLFAGHGSPMNAIEDNRYSNEWKALGDRLPRPQAIAAISAHWFTDKTRVMNSLSPRTIHDMYGFPRPLYEITYPAPGAPEIAGAARTLIERDTLIDNSWGYDHGTWSVLRRIYPKADIPVFQISIDQNAPLEEHYRIGRNIRVLRDQGILIFGSGNIVHNLGRLDPNMQGGYVWAEKFDAYIRDAVFNGNHEKVIHPEQAGEPALLAVPSADHYAPLLYVLGAAYADEDIQVFNEACLLGSISMTGYIIG